MDSNVEQEVNLVLEECGQRLERAFRGSDWREAHRESAPILSNLAARRDVLVSLVKREILSPAFHSKRHINPVPAIPIISSDKFTLVANLWLPRPDRRVDISHQSVHHHGNLLLTTAAVYGPGYESLTYLPIVNGLKARLKMEKQFINSKGNIEFIDAGVPHVVFYPKSLSVTYALWSKDGPSVSSRMGFLSPRLRGLGRRIARSMRISQAIGVNQAHGFDFTVNGEELGPLARRRSYSPAANEFYVNAMKHVAFELGIEDEIIWKAIGVQRSIGAHLVEFAPEHFFLPEANLIRAEVLACK